jgi:hypothetical protein
MPLGRSGTQRKILGGMALVFLLSAAILWFVLPDADDMTLAFCWRMGAVVSVAWLAYDDIQRLPGWILAVLPVLAIVLVRWPRYLLLVVPVAIVVAFLHSRLVRR